MAPFMTWLSRHKLGAMFFGTIVLMAVIYQIIWASRPDYFRVQTDVNFLPLDLIKFVFVYDPGSDTAAIPDIPTRDVSDTVKEILKAASDMKATISVENKMRDDLRATDIKIDEGRRAFEASRSTQIEAFKISQTSAQKAAFEETQQKEQDEFLRPAGVPSCQELPIADAKVSCSLLEIEKTKRALALAQATSAALDIIVDDPQRFIQTPDQQQFLGLERARDQQNIALYKAEQDTLDNRRKLSHLLNKYRDETIGRLTFVDFLYFSVGGATTATFGDISPNHWVVRLLVCFQVIFSIVILNLFVAGLKGPSADGSQNFSRP
jgi:hypothetical protein